MDKANKRVPRVVVKKETGVVYRGTFFSANGSAIGFTRDYNRRNHATRAVESILVMASSKDVEIFQE